MATDIPCVSSHREGGSGKRDPWNPWVDRVADLLRKGVISAQRLFQEAVASMLI